MTKSPISSVANVMSIKFDFFTVGTWLMLWNCTMIVAQIIILKKDFAPIQFLQFPISILLGVFTALGLIIVDGLPVDYYFLRILWVIVGVAVLGFGISLTIVSNTVMNVGEAFVGVISKKLGKEFGSVKVCFDISCVVLSVIMSLIFFDGTIVGTREGTFITAYSTGFVVKFVTPKLKKIEGILCKKKPM